jgi:aminoglycoside 3-N-acetyltransferase I
VIAVRRIGPDDLVAMRALNAVFARAFDDPEAYASAPPADGWLAEQLAKQATVVLVAEQDGAVIGGLVAYELDKLEQARRELYIYDLAVAEAHRRQGVATALIAWLRQHAAERGAWVIYVQADHGDQPAIALYTKLGVREDVLHFDIVPAQGRTTSHPTAASG